MEERVCMQGAFIQHLRGHVHKPDLRRARDAQQLVDAKEGKPESGEHNRLHRRVSHGVTYRKPDEFGELLGSKFQYM